MANKVWKRVLNEEESTANTKVYNRVWVDAPVQAKAAPAPKKPDSKPVPKKAAPKKASEKKKKD